MNKSIKRIRKRSEWRLQKWHSSELIQCIMRMVANSAIPPHILTLVTEVATGVLNAVLYQKFNTHIRLHPEALAARRHRASEREPAFPAMGATVYRFCQCHRSYHRRGKVGPARSQHH